MLGMGSDTLLHMIILFICYHWKLYRSPILQTLIYEEKLESKVHFFFAWMEVSGDEKSTRISFGHQFSIFSRSFWTCSGTCHNICLNFPGPGSWSRCPTPKAICGPHPTYHTAACLANCKNIFEASNIQWQCQSRGPKATWKFRGAKSGLYGGWGGVQKWH
jgi:hypothetical protein